MTDPTTPPQTLAGTDATGATAASGTTEASGPAGPGAEASGATAANEPSGAAGTDAGAGGASGAAAATGATGTTVAPAGIGAADARASWAADADPSPLDSAVVGTELPALEVPVTRTLIVAGAIASRDFEPVHHDHVVAQERGSADLFMNILTTNGLIGRFVTDWTGPRARLRRIDIRLGVPAYPGDTLSVTGSVVDVIDSTATTGSDKGDGGAVVDGLPHEIANPQAHHEPLVSQSPSGAHGGARRVTVAVRASNSRGDHARGTVEVEAL